MMRGALLGMLVLAACTRAGTGNESQPGVPTTSVPPPAPGVVAPPAPPVTAPSVATAVTLELTAVTLADDCGGAPPWGAPPAPSQPASKSARKADSAREGASVPKGRMAKAKRRCEQTSMQLAITAAATGTPTTVDVKSVELFDDTGASVGVLAASSPTRWSEASSTYEAWDGKIAAGQQLSASYVLSQPAWDNVASRWNRTYTLKAVMTVGTGQQAVQRNVMISAPTSLPPNVKT